MHLPDFRTYRIFVLAPSVESDDPNIQYYYDFSQSIAEYTRVFEALHCSWQWQPVNMQNFREVIASIACSQQAQPALVLNLCDGDELNGTPGISVIHELEKHRLPYTGADAFFYDITTSKIPMKRAFDAAAVPTPCWEVVEADAQPAGILKRIGVPLIIKPAVSGGSMGVGVRNVVEDETALQRRLEEIRGGYRGWDLAGGGLLCEQYIAGPEYTSLIVGSGTDPRQWKVYAPVQRIFHPSLPPKEQFLSFDRLWEIYEDEAPMPGNENFFDYHACPPQWIDAIQSISRHAYAAVRGCGYARIDIRQDAATGKLYVLEVNAQCGISEDENYTSIGAILRISGESFASLVEAILQDALQRYFIQHPSIKI